LPAMANQQDQKEDVKRLTKRAITTSMYIMSPMMIGFACVAEEFVSIVLTDKWLPAVPFLRIFCLVYMFYPVHTSNLNAIKAVGRSDVFLKLEAIKKIVGVVLLIVSVRMGVMAMAYSLLINSVFSQIINAWPSKELIDYGFMEQIKDIVPTVVLTFIMALVISSMDLLQLSVVPNLIVKIIVGAVIYVVGSIVSKNETFLYLWDVIKGIVKK